MRDAESAIFQGDELKAAIDASFGPVKTTKNEDDVSNVEQCQGQNSSGPEDWTPTQLKLLLSSGLAVLLSLGVVLISPLFGGGLICSGHRGDFIQFEA